LRKSLGSKRKELRPKDIERICHLYDSFRNEHGTDEHPDDRSKQCCHHNSSR
jgi:type I restriction enzyme M protein